MLGLGEDKKSVITGVEMFRKVLAEGEAGDNVGLLLREEYQTEEGEAKRDDEHFFYVGCWEYQGNDTTAPVLNKEPLEYEAIKVQRVPIAILEL